MNVVSLDDCFSSQTSAPYTVFCDFDGPIINVSSRYYETYRRALAHVAASLQAHINRRSLHALTQQQFWQMKRNRISDVDIAIRSGLQHKQIDMFLNRVQKIVNQANLLHHDCLQPGVRCALELLHVHDIRLVLVTLRQQTQAIQLLKQYRLLHLFSDVKGTPDNTAAYVNCTHHKTQLLQEAIATHCPSDQQIQHSWMIGDTEADILAGQAHGIATIALSCGIRSEVYLAGFTPTCLHEDLLSAAHEIVACGSRSSIRFPSHNLRTA